MKYEVTFSCGHTETIELFGKTTDRERKIAFYENDGLCKECYKNHMRELEETTPITVTININPYDMDGKPIILTLSGNTKPEKEKIKKLGFKWTKASFNGIFGSTSTPSFAWIKYCNPEEMEQLASEMESEFEGLIIENKVTEVGLMYYANFESIRAERQVQLDNLGAAPVPPDLIKDKKWNGKYYGRKGNQSIYLNGEKTDVTENDIKEIETYMKARDEYNEKLKMIN